MAMTKLHKLKMGFSREKMYPPVEDDNFFEVDPPGIPVNIIMTPLEILFFFPSNFDIPPQLLSLYPLEIFIDIISTGGLKFFLKKPNLDIYILVFIWNVTSLPGIP